jgi:hypothetical protein
MAALVRASIFMNRNLSFKASPCDGLWSVMSVPRQARQRATGATGRDARGKSGMAEHAGQAAGSGGFMPQNPVKNAEIAHRNHG